MSFKKDYRNIIGLNDNTTLSNTIGVQLNQGLGRGTITLTNGSASATLNNGSSITNTLGSSNIGTTTNLWNLGSSVGVYPGRISVVDELTGDIYNMSVGYASSTTVFTIGSCTKLSYSLETTSTSANWSGTTGTYKYYLGQLGLNKSPSSLILGTNFQSSSSNIIKTNVRSAVLINSVNLNISATTSNFVGILSGGTIDASNSVMIGSSGTLSAVTNSSLYMTTSGSVTADNSNIIGGSNNSTNAANTALIGGNNNIINVTAQAAYSVIVGGFSHQITGDASDGAGLFVGFNNQITGTGCDYSVIIGGSGHLMNVASTTYAGIFAGQNNIVSAQAAATLGGLNATASGTVSIVAGGRSNTASGNSSGCFVGGYTGSGAAGNTITSAAYSAGIIGGYANTISGALSVILGGVSNTISGVRSVATGSNHNMAAGYSFATGDGHLPTSGATASFSYGTNTTATTYGERAAGSGLLSGMKAQEGTIILSNVSTSATVIDLLDGAGNVGINIPSGEAWVFTITIQSTITSVTNRGSSRVWQSKYLVKNIAGTLSAVIITGLSAAGDAATVAFAATTNSFTGTRFRITAAGAASTTVSWLAVLDYTKIQFA